MKHWHNLPLVSSLAIVLLVHSWLQSRVVAKAQRPTSPHLRIDFTSLLLALTIFSGATNIFAGDSSTNAPVLKVDFTHWMSKAGAGSKSYPYQITACNSLILDFTDYTFVPPARLKGQLPNLIRVHYGDAMDGFVYDLALQPDKKRYELSAAKLPKGLSPLPFTGFAKATDYVVSIGILEPNGSFSEEWVSIIQVR